MRITIDIDESVLNEAMALSGLSTKKAVVNEALKELAAHYGRLQAWENLRGIGWEGDLDEMRRDIDPDEPLLPDHQDAAE
ncbi:type II toxin-antitoxin system VapB family antitoxin [Aliirhizobium terrae]|uniref:type II toxin-antitoxin system VapB family antitoxin n=1 Tax=Terrirhizobium terrae TaxID=2926709 RepID=UPI002577E77F|nr:type II toxin-antitoxin system VapB family antitoxin [Rhizobium sp. CC-CFT758]WJH39457.1 type II toxin-antitoxin system VapB family antitoxin [Rhizobium sp. CC-CFT758]